MRSPERCGIYDVAASHGLTVSDLDRPQLPEVEYFINDIFAEHGMSWAHCWSNDHPEDFSVEVFGADVRRIAHVLRDPAGAIVATSVLNTSIDQGDPAVGEISKLYLAPHLRGKGLGAQLLDDLLQHAPELGYRSLVLATRTEFGNAMRLYPRFGFEPMENTRYPAHENPLYANIRLFRKTLNFP